MALTKVDSQLVNGAITTDSSGNVGVGTSSPTAKLHTQIGSGVSTGIKALNGGGSGLQFYTDSNVANADTFIESPLTGVAMVFRNGGTERMRINAAGDFLFCTSNENADAGVGIKWRYSTTNPYTAITLNNSNGGNSNMHLYNTNASFNGYRFYVMVNGGIYNYQANNSNLSDERTKTNIELADSYLSKICAIPIKTFNYKDEPDGEQKSLGVIAQDVEKIAPELVNSSGVGETPSDGIPLKAIYQTDLQFALMKSIQELNAKFEEYKATHP